MLQEVLDITRRILSLYASDPSYMGDPYDAETRTEKIEKLTQVFFLPVSIWYPIVTHFHR